MNDITVLYSVTMTKQMLDFWRECRVLEVIAAASHKEPVGDEGLDPAAATKKLVKLAFIVR